MAERSFVEEVKKLRLPPGEVFRGEGILAVTKALLESGVAYVAGYQGAPISHLMDVLADAQDILAEYGIRFENSASEATAAATLSASVNYPMRGAITFKATVGTNVASDALANLSSGGVTGGALVIVGEDYGEGSSIMQERSHAFAMKSQMWLIDPRPNLPSIVDSVKYGFELSEASNTPVMLQMRIRSCHLHGQFITSENRKPAFSVKDALENPQRDVDRIVLPPASFLHEHEKINQRWPAAVNFIKERGLNEFFAADAAEIGIALQGGLYNTTIRALQRLGLADVYGNTKIPLYVMNVTYPLVEDEFERFCANKKAVLILEEGQPNFIEQNVASILHQRGIGTRLHGKDVLPMAGEYNTATVLAGLQKWFEIYGFATKAVKTPALDSAPGDLQASEIKRDAGSAQPAPAAIGLAADLAAPEATATTAAAPTTTEDVLARAEIVLADPSQAAPQEDAEGALAPLTETVYPRPPGLCTGCPERPIFSAIRLVERELGVHHISADIGCQLFSILPPFDLGSTTMGYGLGGASAAAFNVAPGSEPAARRAISIMGDGGFWHNGLTSGVANAVFNQSDNLTIIVDNNYTAATGGQDILSTNNTVNPSRSTGHEIEQAVRGVGVSWVRTIRRTYDTRAMTEALREALTTLKKGPKVLIAQSECMLNKQRREKPLVRKAIAEGERVVRERFGVDPDTCTGDHSCIRLSGCPSLTIKDNPDPLRQEPITAVEDSCVGCGHCGEVAHAAVLCPSFYKASIINNPSAWDKRKHKIRTAVISWLQRGLAKRREPYVF